MCLPSEDERVARRNVVRNRAHAGIVVNLDKARIDRLVDG